MILFRRNYEHALALATAVLQDLQPWAKVCVCVCVCVCLRLCVFMHVSVCVCVCLLLLHMRFDAAGESKQSRPSDISSWSHPDAPPPVKWNCGNQMRTHEIMRSKARNPTYDPNMQTSSGQWLPPVPELTCLVHHPVMKCRACSCVTASSSDEVREITKNTNNFTTPKIAAWQVYTCSMTSLFSIAAWQVYTCTCPWSACSCSTAITLWWNQQGWGRACAVSRKSAPQPKTQTHHMPAPEKENKTTKRHAVSRKSAHARCLENQLPSKKLVMLWNFSQQVWGEFPSQVDMPKLLGVQSSRLMLHSQSLQPLHLHHGQLLLAKFERRWGYIWHEALHVRTSATSTSSSASWQNSKGAAGFWHEALHARTSATSTSTFTSTTAPCKDCDSLQAPKWFLKHLFNISSSLILSMPDWRFAT